MGKAATGSRPSAASPDQRKAAADRAAAARARVERNQRRRRLFTLIGVLLGAVVVLAVMVVVRVASGGGTSSSGAKATTAADPVVAAVSSVPTAVFDAVGLDSVKLTPSGTSGPLLTSGGKPEVLYIGAEYCPFCAAERWAVAVALARFGTFHSLGQTTSPPAPEVYPDTATLTFHGATYTSRFLTFVGKETRTNQVVNGEYTALDPLTDAEATLFRKYANGIPFLDIGGRYLLNGATYDPGVLAGKTHAQIAEALSRPGSAIAQAVDGSANQLTAAFCRLTGQQPAAVCTSAGVRAAAGALAGRP